MKISLKSDLSFLEPQGASGSAEYFINYGTVLEEMLQGGDEGIGAERFCPGTLLAQIGDDSS